MIIKLLVNFLMVKSIGMKLSGVARLVPGNFWVGSTPAQSLRGRPWPAPRPFARNLSPPWFLVLLGYVIPFWKGLGAELQVLKGGGLEGVIFLAEICNFV